MNRRKSKTAESAAVASVPASSRDRDHPLALALAADASWIMLNLPLAKIGEVDGVHRMRTSVRRLRSDLKTFRDRIDAPTLSQVVEELKWLFAALGQVRELDVQSRWCRRLAETAEDRERLAPLFQELERRRTSAMVGLSEVLESERFWRLAARLARGLPLASALADAAEGSDPPSTDLDAGRLASLCAKLDKAARGADSETPDEAFHDVRLVAKRARYAAEAIARWSRCRRSAKQAGRLAVKVRRIQDALGDRQDAVVAAQTVQDIMQSLGVDDPRVLAARDRLSASLTRLCERSTVKSLELLKRFRRKRADRFGKSTAA